jgi:long-chain acyl-CoA synthetase
MFDENISEIQLEKISKKNLNMIPFSRLLTNNNILPFPKIDPDTIFTFSYTSGTTGDPKGAIISHKNFVGTISNCKESSLNFNKDDVQICFLPLAHIY